MLVYDAGTFSLNGSYAARRSRLSDLAGVDYALYDTLGDKTTQWGSVKGTSAIVGEMEIPPGKYYPFSSETSASDSARAANASNPASAEVELRRYKYGELLYPSFVTSGQYSGEVLFQSKVGIVAGEHPYRSWVRAFREPSARISQSQHGWTSDACLSQVLREAGSRVALFGVRAGWSRRPWS